MLFRFSLLNFSALSWASLSIAASIPATARTTGCRCVPGEACWPSAPQWNQFNETIGGKLVATVPLASVCHDSAFGPYDEDRCDALKSNWFDPETHIKSSSSIMAPFFTNDSCNPFLPRDAPCTIGNFAVYAVNATCASDFQAVIAFVRKYNIRLVIRNSGHDYNGKSTGAGALSIWTQHMKHKELIQYNSPSYNGSALKLGAGINGIESYEFAHDHGLVSVGGDCPTVGITGGWTQGGGGHGPGVSKFGFGADQALEWEVVTGTGEILIANREQNTDLFFALSGGGGGTYGVVSSLTARVYPDLVSTAASLSFNSTSKDAESYWDTVATWQASMPTFTSNGCFLIWSVNLNEFSLEPGNCLGLSKNQTLQLLQPVLNKLHDHGIKYNLSVKEYPKFLPSYKEYNLAFPKNVSESQIGAQLVPRTVLDNNNTELIAIYRRALAVHVQGITVQSVNATNQGFDPSHVGLAPERREAAFNLIFHTSYDQTNYSVDIQRANAMTDEYLPLLKPLIPHPHAYLNEADFQQPDFQQVFYGKNYQRLLQIKDKYDPDQIFYALGAVGSDRFYEDREHGGRLCNV